MISLPAGTDLKPKMGKGQKDYKTKVRDMFEKLRSFREETNRQISDIINSHRSSISEGIDDLAKEVGEYLCIWGGHLLIRTLRCFERQSAQWGDCIGATSESKRTKIR